MIPQMCSNSQIFRYGGYPRPSKFMSWRKHWSTLNSLQELKKHEEDIVCDRQLDRKITLAKATVFTFHGQIHNLSTVRMFELDINVLQ